MNEDDYTPEPVPLTAYEAEIGANPDQPAGGHQAPPHDLAAEAAALGAALLNPEAARTLIDELDAGDYYRPAHGHVHDAIAALHHDGAPIDPITVADQLTATGHLDDIGGPGGLIDLEAGVSNTSNAAHYARIVAAHANRRRLIAAADTIARHGWDTGTDIDQAIGDARASLDQLAATATRTTERLIGGGAFLHDQPTEPPAIWGSGTEVLWAQGESLLLVGPTGVGKTTIAAQLLEGLLIGGDLLGWPVTPTDGRVLYLAMDRPAQIARALHRTLGHIDRATLDERLAVWKGPLPNDLGTHPDTLATLARNAGATTVIIDSLKDAAVKLNTDEVGGNLNRALQHCLAEGIDVLASHHHRKAERGTSRAPTTVDELFGSSLIASGAGSVIQLWGAPGDLVVDLTHLKQPAEQVGPLKIAHDHQAGRTTVTRGFDPVAAIRNAPRGLTTIDVARLMHERPTGEVPENERRKTLRKLTGLERKGLIHSPHEPGHDAQGHLEARRWYAVEHSQNHAA